MDNVNNCENEFAMKNFSWLIKNKEKINRKINKLSNFNHTKL